MELLASVVVDGFPASVGATTSKARWVSQVAAAARSAFGVPLDSRNLFVRVVVFHSTARQRFDIHNMAKPIFDALVGVAYYDDAQILRTEQSKRPLGGSYQLANPEGRVVANLADQREFVYLQFFELTDEEVSEV